MAKTWRLGTRGSQLATTQSGIVARALEEATGDAVELVIIKTRGDRIQDRPLSQVGGKGLFTKEIEDSLLAGTVDFAVHSMKDMPTDNPEGLVFGAIPKREDPRDVLVGAKLDDLPQGAVVGTGSARRRLQLLSRRPDLDIRGIRGNVDTRIAKQRAGDYAAIVLAASGIARLGRSSEVDEYLDPSWMVPAPGQGALAVQCREGDTDMLKALGLLHHTVTAESVAAERAFLDAVQGGCSVPAACHASREGDHLVLRGFFGREDGVWVGESGTCTVDEGVAAGIELATRLRVRLSAQPQRIA